jgi:hypothetical protein
MGPDESLNDLVKASAAIQRQVAQLSRSGTLEAMETPAMETPAMEETLLEESTSTHQANSNPHAVQKDGAAVKPKAVARKHPQAAQGAQLHPRINPALHGEAAYHQKHPLSVAMQACHAQQHGAAVQCLDSSRRACHGVWVKAYLQCFSTFSQAHKWLERAGRLPVQHHSVKKAPKVRLSSSLRRTAQLHCAHAYASFSVKCKAAHGRVGALCHDYATRSGALAVGAAQRCGSMHSQAEAICARERAAGRAQCESAWARAKSATLHGQAMAHHMDKDAFVSVEDQLHRAQMESMAHLKAATHQLQEARRSGMVSRDGKDEDAALVELFASHGVGLSLSALGTEVARTAPNGKETMLLQGEQDSSNTIADPNSSRQVPLYEQQKQLYQETLASDE